MLSRKTFTSKILWVICIWMWWHTMAGNIWFWWMVIHSSCLQRGCKEPNHLKTLLKFSARFLAYGKSRVITTDNEPLLTSVVQDFCNRRMILLLGLSPNHSLSNRMAEHGIKEFTRLLHKLDKVSSIDDIILEINTNPKKCGFVPGEMFFRRKHGINMFFTEKVRYWTERENKQDARDKLRIKKNLKRRDLPKLKIGDFVMFKKEKDEKLNMWILKT